MGMEGNYAFYHLFFFGVKGHICDCMHPFCVLMFYVGQFLFFSVVAWYTSNYLSPTIYVLSENGTTSMISAHQFILLIFSMQAVGLFEYFSF